MQSKRNKNEINSPQSVTLPKARFPRRQSRIFDRFIGAIHGMEVSIIQKKVVNDFSMTSIERREALSISLSLAKRAGFRMDIHQQNDKTCI